jgi:hypothetical protein
MKRARRAFIAVAVIIGTTVVAGVTPASAAIKDSVCDSGEVCWYNGNGGGDLYDNNNGTDGDLGNNSYPATGGGVNNTFDSVDNRDCCTLVQLHDGFNSAGDNLSGAGTCIGNHFFSFVNFGTANRGSSHRPRTFAQCS